MFKVCWDKEINGVLLCQSCDEPLNISPRPVFREELDILGFDRYWKYPQDSKSPLLWALGRRYFYKGIWVAEAKGGNLFEAPEIIITEDGKNLTLQPIDTRKLIEKNKEALFILENEAIDFVLDTYTKYKNRVDFIAVAFSGGKDSQVVLDIVSRVLPPDEFIVVFSDTTMELPHTYEIVEHTKKEYQKKYPTLKFYTVKPPKSAIEFWEDFGPPSRIHRWCCTVIKTAPFVNFIRELYHEKGGKKVPKILVFDGVRAEESPVRRGYGRIAFGVKHITQINAEVIKYLNLTEVFLYQCIRNIQINTLYRHGLLRVGCLVCPFSSNWSEYLVSKLNNSKFHQFLSKLFILTKNLNIKNTDNQKTYLKDGEWKKRAGGIGVESPLFLRCLEENNKVTFISNNFKLDKFEWLNTLGPMDIRYQNGQIIFKIKTRQQTINLTLLNNQVNFENIYNKNLLNYLKKIFNKIVFCNGCKACETECRTGALKISAKIYVDSLKCNNCLNCIDFCEKGCLIAKSLQVADNGGAMNTDKIKIANYLTFGARQEWVEGFLFNPYDWLKNNKLGNKQFESMKVWLKEMELLNKNSVTEKATLLSKLLHHSREMVWEILWVNLYHNSDICRFYLDEFDWGQQISSADFKNILKTRFPYLSHRTIESGVTSFLNLLENSPIGQEFEIGRVIKIKKERVICKNRKREIRPFTAVYSLYKLLIEKQRRNFVLNELIDRGFNGGPFKIFGEDKDNFIKNLTLIRERNGHLIDFSFTADLENINLTKGLSDTDILKSIVQFLN